MTCAVPTWNSAATLEQTLLSLRRQRAVTWRVIVVDSGSTDGTLEICDRNAVEVRYCPPGNMYAAINVGLRGAESPWLTYVNSDDWLYDDAWGRLTETGERYVANFVYGGCDYVDGHGRFRARYRACPPGHVLPLLRLGVMGFAQPAALFRRTAFETLSGFDERYRYAADAHFFARICQRVGRVVRCDGPPVAAFRVHAGQLSQKQHAAMDDEKRRLRDELLSPPRLGDRWALWRWRLSNAQNQLWR